MFYESLLAYKIIKLFKSYIILHYGVYTKFKLLKRRKKYRPYHKTVCLEKKAIPKKGNGIKKANRITIFHLWGRLGYQMGSDRCG